MKTIVTAAILVAGLTGVAGSAMADKTWNSDPSTYWPPRTQSEAIEVRPAQAKSKAYKHYYKAPKTHAKSQGRTAR